MAWKEDNTNALIAGGSGTLAGGGLLALGIFGGQPWLIPIGAGMAASGLGTAFAGGMDALSDDPEEILLPDDVQGLINRGNQRGVVSQLLSPHITGVQSIRNPRAGRHPYASSIVDGLTGNAESGLGQLGAMNVEAIEDWYRKRDRWDRQTNDTIMSLYGKQYQLGQLANDAYLNALNLQEQIRQSNVTNILDRDNLRAQRVRVGGAIGARIGGLLGQMKPIEAEKPKTSWRMDTTPRGWAPTRWRGVDDDNVLA